MPQMRASSPTASRWRGRCASTGSTDRLPPRRRDDRRHGRRVAAAGVRDERPRHLDAARRLSRSGGRAGRRRVLGQGLRAHDELPYREDFALQPTTAYEASKAAADMIARSYAPAYGLPVAVTRFANIYGGGDLNFSRLVPEAVCAAIDGRPPVLRSDGSPERDFLYVEDAAAAYLAIAVRARPRRRARRGLQRRRRPAAPGRRGRRDDRRARRNRRRARGPRRGQPGRRDRPPVRRRHEDPRALRLEARGRPARRASSGRSSGIEPTPKRAPADEPLGLSEARPAGFEPATSALRRRALYPLSYGREGRKR